MNTKMYLETIAPGMKARLSPAYRQSNGIKGAQYNIGKTKKEIKNNQNIFKSFVNDKKSF